jgi:hypothetical protein
VINVKLVAFLRITKQKIDYFMKHLFCLFVTIAWLVTNIFGQESSHDLLAYHAHFETDIQLTRLIKKHPKVATLKAILVICDNYESPENNKIAQSVRVDMGTMSQLLNILEKRNIMKVEKTILQGRKATLENIRTTMRSLQAGSDDVILFYFSGHGGMQNGRTFLVTADEKDLSRTEIEGMINPKSARLKIIITDACSNDVDGLSATRSLARNNQQIEAGAFDAIYKDLFLNHQGLMHLSASTEGEYAWSNDNFGGFFTYYFVKEGLIKKPVNNWQTIFGNAKDKTSQMFMRMPADQRADLAKEGIKNQTAKAFSMPKAKSNTIANNNNNNNTNNTGGNTNQNNIPSGNISIDNYTGQTINFYLDNNLANATWTEAKVKQMSIGADKTVKIPQAFAVVGFKVKSKDFYYELENGNNYFFAFDENDEIDLFFKDESTNAQNFNDVAKINYAQLLVGNWEWEDNATGELVISTFNKNGSFTDHYQEQNIKEQGKWSVTRETYERKEYNIATFFIKEEDGSELELNYVIMLEEEYPNEIQLVFINALHNGEEIPAEEAEEYFEPTIMMYKVN